MMKKIFLFTTLITASMLSAAQEIQSVKIAELEQFIRDAKTPLVINMWATWCKPCVEEIPYFIRETELHNGKQSADTGTIQLILVSLDFKDAFPDDITSFIKKRNIRAVLFWLDETNADYFCPRIDPAWSGAIPATLFLNPRTGYRRFFERQLTEKEFSESIRELVR
ncbi:MAG: hypothetical protein ACO25B_12285 [Chitinophagaceae bacterium]